MRPGFAQLLMLAIPGLVASCALHFPSIDGGDELQSQGNEPTLLVESSPDVPVVMFADELHTGLVLKLGWLKRHGYVPPAEIGEHEHVVFSWGDETAYVQERWLTPWQVIDALFMPSPSVMEIIPVDWNIPEVMPTQRLYQGFAPEASGAEVVAFLNQCSVRYEDGRPVTVGTSSWGRGMLIRSPHGYYFPRICNIWTVDALRAAGFRIGGLRGLSADGMVRQVTKPANGFQQIWAPEWQMSDPPSTL